MTEIDRIEGLDRDLRVLGERVARAGYDPRRTLRRLRWTDRWQLVVLVATASAITAALIAGSWKAALVLAVFVLPDRVYEWYTRKSDREALLVDGDFFEHEREKLQRRLLSQRFRALLGLGLAGALAWKAQSTAKEPTVLWIMAALLAVHALVRLFVFIPAFVRELRDLGGHASGGWSTAAFVFFLFLVTPFLVLYGVIRRAVRRLLGRPVEDDE